MVFCVTAPRELGGEDALVEVPVGKSDGAGVNRVFGQPGHDGDDGTGIDAAGEEGAERHVGDQPEAHRLAYALYQFLGGRAVI